MAATYRAVMVTKRGGPENLRVVELPVEPRGPGNCASVYVLPEWDRPTLYYWPENIGMCRECLWCPVYEVAGAPTIGPAGPTAN
jgi:hypothetical protein